MKTLFRKVVEEVDDDGVITNVETLITADCIHDVFENTNSYRDHINMELISITRVGHVACDLTNDVPFK